MVIGVLADTRKPLTEQEKKALSRHFRGVSLILHAGGIGSLKVLEQLEEIAPVWAVTGNQEEGWVKDRVRQKEWLRLEGGLRVGLIHGYGIPFGLKKRLVREFEDMGGVDLLVYGRNFEPCARSLNGVYFFNPGSFSGGLPEGRKGVGPPRIGLVFAEKRRLEGLAGIPLWGRA